MKAKMTRGLGAEDAPGQIVTIGGVQYQADAEGQLRDAEGNLRLDPDLDAEISRAMADPALAVNPTGNPYK